jgi:hypothetical protein
MENVAFDLLKKDPPIELPAFPQDELYQSFQLPSSCTDSTECGDDSEYVYSVIHMVCALRAVCWFMSVLSANEWHKCMQQTDVCTVYLWNYIARKRLVIWIFLSCQSSENLLYYLQTNVRKLIWTHITLQFFVYSQVFQRNSTNFRQTVDQYLKLTKL